MICESNLSPKVAQDLAGDYAVFANTSEAEEKWRCDCVSRSLPYRLPLTLDVIVVPQRSSMRPDIKFSTLFCKTEKSFPPVVLTFGLLHNSFTYQLG